jgi:hypothetical protein
MFVNHCHQHASFRVTQRYLAARPAGHRGQGTGAWGKKSGKSSRARLDYHPHVAPGNL